MKILFVHNRYLATGGEDTVFELETALLRKNGHEVIEFVEDNRELLNIPKWKGALDAVWSSRTYRTLTDIISRHKPHIAHFHNTFLRVSPSAYYACQKQGVPVVQTLHNYRIVCPSGLLHRNNRNICEDCLTKPVPYPSVIHGCWQRSPVKTLIPATIVTFHRFLRTWDNKINIYIALTDFSRQKFIQAGLHPSKIVVKPNFISIPDFREEPRQDFFLYVGRLSPEKGIFTLLNAWKRIKDARLLIVGDGPLYEEVRHFKQIHCLHNVEVLGFLSRLQIFQLMRQAACLVFPSEWYEGFPMSIIEGFACGLPVIASDLGGRNEIVENGKVGLLYNSGDPIDLESKVRWIIDHPDLAKQMGYNARKAYEDKYTPERNYKILLSIYQQILDIHSDQ